MCVLCKRGKACVPVLLLVALHSTELSCLPEHEILEPLNNFSILKFVFVMVGCGRDCVRHVLIRGTGAARETEGTLQDQGCEVPPETTQQGEASRWSEA